MTNEIENNNSIIANEGFLALNSMAEMMNDFEEDLQGLDLTLTRIKFPGAGGTAFEIPTDDDEDSDPVKELIAVVVHQHPAFAYYQTAYNGSKNPPDCHSIDGKMGVGAPGGDCTKCSMNQFGSGANGKSKACQNRRNLYLLKEGELFPVMLMLPPGSIRKYTNYVKTLLTRGLRVSQVVTRISLKKQRSQDGIEYAQAVFKMVRLLTPEERAAVAPAGEMARVYSLRMTSDVVTEDEGTFVDVETGEVIEPLK